MSSSKLSVSEVIEDLESQIADLEQQEAFHARQEAFHREQRAACAGHLERLRERYLGFKTAAEAVGEVVRRGRPSSRLRPAEDDGRAVRPHGGPSPSQSAFSREEVARCASGRQALVSVLAEA